MRRYSIDVCVMCIFLLVSKIEIHLEGLISTNNENDPLNEIIVSYFDCWNLEIAQSTNFFTFLTNCFYISVEWRELWISIFWESSLENEIDKNHFQMSHRVCFRFKISISAVQLIRRKRNVNVRFECWRIDLLFIAHISWNFLDFIVTYIRNDCFAHCIRNDIDLE